jgi:hypothetical protein
MTEIKKTAAGHTRTLISAALDPSFPLAFRIWAMSSLRAVGNAEAVDALLTLFASPDCDLQVRCYAAFCLARLSDARMVPKLLAFAADNSQPTDIRAAALLALKQFANSVQEVQDLLIALSREEGAPQLARLSLASLSSSTNRASVEALTQGIAADDYGVRVASVQSLGDIAKSVDASAQLARKAIQDAAYAVIGELAATAVDVPGHSTAEQDDRQRWIRATIHALNYAPTPQTSRILSDMYSAAGDARLRQDVVSTAGGLPKDEILHALLIRGLIDPVPKIRMLSARSLLSLTKGADASVVLNAMNAESNASVRRDMARALRPYVQGDIPEGVTP